MNPYRDRIGRFRSPTTREAAPLLARMLRAKSEPHRKGWQARRAKRSAEIMAHIDALKLDTAMQRGWL